MKFITCVVDFKQYFFDQIWSQNVEKHDIDIKHMSLKFMIQSMQAYSNQGHFDTK